MTWRLAKSLETLRAQLDARWPDRDRTSDGTIGCRTRPVESALQMSAPRAALTAEGLADTLAGGIDVAERICDIPGCGRPHHSHGFCRAHSNRFRWTGSATSGKPVRIVGDDGRRWLSKLRIDGECWTWTGPLYRNGYGKIHIGPLKGGRTRLVHRWTYEQIVGLIPDGLALDHLCRNRACCNPAHLEPVTVAENNRRAKRDHCINGHAYGEMNLYIDPRGHRQCRTCRAAASERAKARCA